FSWTEARVNEELERVITEAFDTLVDTYESNNVRNLRTAAYVVGIGRIVDAYDQAGNWP
ncbi:Glu/Leu/Phe/Val dehydrogenase, partial [Halorubrum sp. SD626R]